MDGNRYVVEQVNWMGCLGVWGRDGWMGGWVEDDNGGFEE